MDSSHETDETEDEPETRCGVFGFYPQWLQILASKKSYVILFGLVGMNQFAISSYVVATITTLEKRFKIPSQTSGFLTGGWDIGTIMSSITMAYIGSQGHKTRWVAFGTFVTSIACFSQLLPYYIYGPGSEALAIANSGNITGNSTSTSSLCGPGSLHHEDCSEGSDGVSSTPSKLIFMSQILLGVGTSMYWTLGIAYLDDNVRKDQAPWLMAVSSTIRLFGSPIGFWVAAKCLEYFADPNLEPPITNKDPRWIGAWWLGWILFGSVAVFFSFLLTLFPRALPRAPRQKKEKVNSKEPTSKLKGFTEMLNRLFKNPLLLCNTFSYVFYMFGVTGFWVFMPKYMETQFHMTASRANLVTGTMGLLSAAFGVILAGYVMSSFKPSARTLSAWNLGVEFLGVLCMFLYANLGCPELDFRVGWTEDKTSWILKESCNSGCNCGPDVQFEPVCDIDRSITYFSPCHAGCTGMAFENGAKIFTNCSCIVESFTAVESHCPVECEFNLMLFLICYCIVSFLSSSSHAGIAIIQFRTVKPEDKSVSIALSEMLCSAISYIPSPIVFGYLLDQACMVWSTTCGDEGNCWLYEGQTLRSHLNYTAAAFLTIALVFDYGVWYYSKNLALYDNEDEENNQIQKTENITHKEDVALQSLTT